MKNFKYVVLICAAVIAITAAYFSVYGISSLFSGAFIAVLIMASALEIGKIVAATFLKQYWKHLNWKLRSFMASQVILLMLITSGGIYGFLSSAYQETSRGAVEQDASVQSLQAQQTLYITDVARNEERMTSLTASRAQLISRTDSLYARGLTQAARRTEESVARTDAQIDTLTQKGQPARDSVAQIAQQIVAVQTDSGVSAEIGPLKFVALSIGTDIDTVVKWFIFMIIIVFDPLGIALFLAAITIRDIENMETTPTTPDEPANVLPIPELVNEPVETIPETPTFENVYLNLPDHEDVITYDDDLTADSVSESNVIEDEMSMQRRQRIEDLFNLYRTSGDTDERATLSREIEDQLNQTTEPFAIPNNQQVSTRFGSNGGMKIETHDRD